MGHIHPAAVRGTTRAIFFKQWGGVQKAKTGRRLNGKTYDAMPALSTHPPLERAERERLIAQVDTSRWTDTPLLQITRRHNVA
jgi:hypothetical protein